jgi:hypothetical protein
MSHRQWPDWWRFPPNHVLIVGTNDLVGACELHNQDG